MADLVEAPLSINGHSISSNEPPSPNAVNRKYLYVRGRVPLKAEHKRQLRAVSVEVFEYLGSNTYLCRYLPDDLQPVRDLPFVAQANVYGRRLKVSEFLRDAVRNAQAEHPENPTVTVAVTLHKQENATPELIDRLAAQSGLAADAITVDHNQLRLTVTQDALDRIAEIDEVRTIEPFILTVPRNDASAITMDATPHAISTLSGNGYEGKDQVVHVADSGFDKGSLTDIHPAFSKDRIVALLDNDLRKGLTNDPSGHGTHVSGSILGDGISASMGLSENGFKIRGVAPAAKLVMKSLHFEFLHPVTGEMADAFNVPPNLWDLFAPAYADYHARISSNSWGSVWSGSQEPYNNEAGSVDRFIWHQQDFTILFAAGNDGHRRSPSRAHIGGSSGSKNCISVGATQANRRIRGAAFHAAGTPGDTKSLAFFSSHGPTLEKRLKPDVVAPGLPILSASSRDPTITAEMRNQYGITADQDWVYSSGTSMACPLVAGCCVILREALIKTAGVEKPSAALIKALLVNGAVDIGLPRNKQGFGLVNLKRALVPVELRTDDSRAGFADEGFVTGKKLGEDDEWVHEIEVPAPAEGRPQVLKVTLAYSDRYGPELQNNLVLSVESGGVEKLGAEGLEAENNVEQVVWKNVPAGKVKMRVVADRISRLDDKQPFAVVWCLYTEA